MWESTRQEDYEVYQTIWNYSWSDVRGRGYIKQNAPPALAFYKVVIWMVYVSSFSVNGASRVVITVSA